MRLFGFILLAVAVIATVEQVNGENIVYCYWGTWSHYRQGNGQFRVANIDPFLCTHIGYAFFGLDYNGAIKSLDPWLDLPDNYGLDNIAKTVALKKINPNLKVLASIGGWNEGSSKYSEMAGDPNKRKVFVNSVIAFLQKYKFDGLDFDWEYPNQRGGVPADKANHITLLQELKTEFNKKNYILTVAVAAAEASASLSYNIPALSQTVDFINVMTYDFGGAWNNYLSFNSPLQGPAGDPNTVTASIEFWLKAGASASKLVLGIPLYGRTFTMANPSQFTVNSPAYGGGESGPYTRERGYLGYNEFCEYHSDWTQAWDSDYLAPYAYKGDQWIGYDNPKTIELKMNFIKEKKLAGAMVWSIETDDFRGLCGQKFPLLNAIKSNMLKSNEKIIANSTSIKNTNKKTDGTNNCAINGIFANEEKRENFIICDSGIPLKFECPMGLHFDPVIRACNWPSLVGSNDNL